VWSQPQHCRQLAGAFSLRPDSLRTFTNIFKDLGGPRFEEGISGAFIPNGLEGKLVVAMIGVTTELRIGDLAASHTQVERIAELKKSKCETIGTKSLTRVIVYAYTW